MKAGITSPDRIAGTANVKDQAAAIHDVRVPAARMSPMELIAKIQGIDGCSKEQADEQIKSFEKAFRAL